MIGRLPECALTAVSDWYLTKPVGVEGQDWYLNGVAGVAAGISARSLLENLMAIEGELGRVRVVRWEPRIIDLDILLYGEDIIHEEGLTIPHPRMHRRKFVLAPLVQLDPGLVHPSLGLTMAELLERVSGGAQVVVPWKDG
jgi:2-amino-4-hydroxy-6-hydroxymethyldihydropteridine diphosphokinase